MAMLTYCRGVLSVQCSKKKETFRPETAKNFPIHVGQVFLVPLYYRRIPETQKVILFIIRESSFFLSTVCAAILILEVHCLTTNN